MRPLRVLTMWFVLGTAPAWALDPGVLGPGKVDKRGAWTLSVRAERFEGTVPGPWPYYSQTGPVTDSLFDYPVIVLQGPAKIRWEWPTLQPGAEARSLAGLRLESDWDGDGRPEVAARLGNLYVLGSGVKPSGVIGVSEVLLRPGSSGLWKPPVNLGGHSGDEDGTQISVLSLALVPGKDPEPVRWVWIQGESGGPAHLQATRMRWNGGDLTEGVSYQQSAPASEGLGVTLADDRVNLRQGPGTEYPSRGLLTKGTKLLVQGLDPSPGAAGNLRGPWFSVRVADGPLAGAAGWVFGWFVSPEF